MTLREAKGVSLRLYSVLFLGIVALATAECAQIVAVLLVFSLMVGPAAAQRLTAGIAAGLLLLAGLALFESLGRDHARLLYGLAQQLLDHPLSAASNIAFLILPGANWARMTDRAAKRPELELSNSKRAVAVDEPPQP